MIFSRSTSISSSLGIEDIKGKLLGQKFNVHDLQFEISEKDSILRIIPHTEYEEKFRILPITHIKLRQNGSTTNVAMKSKPRRIDIGGPYLLVVFCLFLVICGGYLYIFQQEQMLIPSVIMMGLGLIIFIILWMSLERGYFDYFRKQKTYIKSLIA